MESDASASVLQYSTEGRSPCMLCDEVFPAREMHSMLALGADYLCKARDMVVSGAGIATNA